METFTRARNIEYAEYVHAGTVHVVDQVTEYHTERLVDISSRKIP